MSKLDMSNLRDHIPNKRYPRDYGYQLDEKTTIHFRGNRGAFLIKARNSWDGGYDQVQIGNDQLEEFLDFINYVKEMNKGDLRPDSML